ncbi:hypothetical protein N8I77_007841 [Diaporthe amygdali]|uniref:Rhodopsin domain-containing protein n=2 Tax=Phomopsis amygdali TaxID=1214568 RepID=A0AAD9SCL3_PHOAM|nr:hypothetical protein N8I77_007841 [Diaporthe amygdali]
MVSYTPLPMTTVVEAHLIINIVLVGVTVLVVILRILSRILARSRLGMDDYLTMLAVPQGIGMLVLQALFARSGLGYEFSKVSGNWRFITLLILPFEVLFSACVLTTKLSVLFFYKRVFTSNAMRLATRVTLVIVVLWGVGNLLQTFLVCHMIDGTWHAINTDFCPDLQSSFISIGLFNLITNTIIMLVPLYTVWTLKKVSVSTRLGLSAVFLLNFGVIVVSVTRIAVMIGVRDLSDVIDSMVTVTFLSVFEVNLSIFCNSLPMLLPLYTYWKNRRFGGDGEDEYVSRLRGDSQSRRHEHLVEDLTNGIPLETIYGKDNVHFTTTVGRGESSRRTNEEQSEDDGSDSESTRRLPRNAQAITIETKWSITEETVK